MGRKIAGELLPRSEEWISIAEAIEVSRACGAAAPEDEARELFVTLAASGAARIGNADRGRPRWWMGDQIQLRRQLDDFLGNAAADDPAGPTMNALLDIVDVERLAAEINSSGE